ncbi:MAG: hypothetical protein Q8O63_06080, partial [Hoeflea sp.]|nr:hypothetical protein [Hoeflea sp.]
AEYKRRGGAIVSTGGGDDSSSGKRSGGLLAALFGGGDEDEVPEAIAAAPVPVAAPKRTEIAALPGVPDAPAEAAPPADELALALPVRGPVPVARPALEPPVVVAALAPPEPVLPAQAEIEAFAAAANADVAPSPPANIDLASIRAPIPELLAERAPGFKPAADVENAPETQAVEVAALPVPSLIEARMLAAAPLPPEGIPSAPPLAASASTVTPAPKTPELSPATTAVVAALPSGNDFIPLPIRRPGDRAGDRLPAIEVAALDPVKAQRGARLAATATTASAPRKGDRPNASAVADQAPRTAIRTEPKLTETMISKWALSQERVNTMSTLPGKGRHFVVSQLRAAPTVVYANAFAPGGELVHDQFTGSAVNFISVARFEN